MELYPEQKIKPGELFILDGPNAYGDPRVSLFSYDPYNEELSSVFGSLDQVADTTDKRRNRAHNSALIWADNRIRQYSEPWFVSPSNASENIGSGWQVTSPFPYDLSQSSLEEFYDVSTSTSPLRREGDQLKWYENGIYGSYWGSGPGFGNFDEGIEASATLDLLIDVDYLTPLEDKSKIQWNQVNQRWETIFIAPLVSNRADVVTGLQAEDSQALTYSEDLDKWSSEDAVTEGVLTIKDGRRTVNKDFEYLVAPGRPDRISGVDILLTEMYRSESTPINPYGIDLRLRNGVSIRSDDGSGSPFWATFPGGSFRFDNAQAVPFNLSSQVLTVGALDDRDLAPASSWSNPNPSLFSPDAGYEGDFTLQFWFQMDEGFAPDVNTVYSSSLFESNILSVEIVQPDGIYNTYRNVEVTFRGEVNAFGDSITVLSGLTGGIDHHIAIQWDNTAFRLKVWVDGHLSGLIEVDGLSGISDQSAAPFLVNDLDFGSGVLGYMADINLTLQKEYTDEYVEFLGQKDFIPPSGWGRKTVEGPKASVKTLGVTHTGLFSWIAQSSPYEWRTAFSSDAFDTFSQDLSIDTNAFNVGGVLTWDSTSGKFKTSNIAVAGDGKTIKKNPGALKDFAYNVIFNPSLHSDRAGAHSGDIQPAVYRTQSGVLNQYPVEGLSWDWGLSEGEPEKVFAVGYPTLSQLDVGKGWTQTPSRTGGVFQGNTRSSSTWGYYGSWIDNTPPPSDRNFLTIAGYNSAYGTGFWSWGIKFRSFAAADSGTLVESDAIKIEGNTITISANGSGVDFPNKNIDPDGYADAVWNMGFDDEFSFELSDSFSLLPNQVNEVNVIIDLQSQKLTVYVNSKRVNIDFCSSSSGNFAAGSEPGRLTEYDVSFPSDGVWANKGLPEYIAIGGFETKRLIMNSGLGRIGADGVFDLLGAFCNIVKPADFSHTRYYDFSDLYNAEVSQPGASVFTGTEGLQSSDELTKIGEPLTELDGQKLGAGRSLARLGTFGDSGFFNAFFNFFSAPSNSGGYDVSTDSFVQILVGNFNAKKSRLQAALPQDIYERSAPDRYVLYAPGRTRFYSDVTTPSDDWLTGQTFIYQNGSWVAGVPDSTSPIFVNRYEHLETLNEGDFMYWDVALNGYRAEQPRSYIQYGLEALTDVIVPQAPESNSTIVYDQLNQTFVSRGARYYSELQSLLDVYYQRSPDDGDLLRWSAESQSFRLADLGQAIEIEDLSDVAATVEGLGNNNWYFWDEAAREWSPRVGISPVQGEWQTFLELDFDLSRKGRRLFNFGSPGTTWTDVINGLDATGPLHFTDTAQTCSNSERGDGGDFNYAEVHSGMPPGIFGGGDFESGNSDLPPEMVLGLDGGEFVETLDPDYHNYADNVTLSDVAFQFNFDQLDPLTDKSLTPLAQPAVLFGDAYLMDYNSAYGGGSARVYVWGENTDAQWQRFAATHSGINCDIEDRFDIADESWSLECSLRFGDYGDDPVSDPNGNTGDGGLGNGPIASPLSFSSREQYIFAAGGPGDSLVFYVKLVNETNGDGNLERKLRLAWRDLSTDQMLTYDFNGSSLHSGTKWSWQHFAISYDAPGKRLAAFYAGSRIGVVSFLNAPGWTGMNFKTAAAVNGYKFCLGGIPYTDNDTLPYSLVGSIDEVRLVVGRYQYDPIASVLSPPSQGLRLTELPETFSSAYLTPSTPRVVSLVNFNQYFENFYTGYDLTGFVWGANPFTLKWPTRLIRNEETNQPGYSEEVNLSTSTGSFDNNVLSPGGNTENRVGGSGLVTQLCPSLNFPYEDFTVEAIIECRSYFSDGRDRNSTQYLVSVASDLDLTDSTKGRSWSILVFPKEQEFGTNGANSPREQGVRFEWWTQDQEYHYLDFKLAPNVFNGQGRSGWGHVVIQRSIIRQSVTVFINEARLELFHPRLGEPFIDVSENLNPRLAIGMDAQVNFDTGNDFDGLMDCIRIVRGVCVYGQYAAWPEKELYLSAN